jgi:hypothetical protein
MTSIGPPRPLRRLQLHKPLHRWSTSASGRIGEDSSDAVRGAGAAGRGLAALFEQWADPVAAHMAAFTAPDHMNRNASSAAGLG